jgi:hypothetical protein
MNCFPQPNALNFSAFLPRRVNRCWLATTRSHRKTWYVFGVTVDRIISWALLFSSPIFASKARTWTASKEASPLVISYIANQLGVNPMGIVQYATEREATRFEHLAELQKTYGFRQFTARDYRELSA